YLFVLLAAKTRSKSVRSGYATTTRVGRKITTHFKGGVYCYLGTAFISKIKNRPVVIVRTVYGSYGKIKVAAGLHFKRIPYIVFFACREAGVQRVYFVQDNSL